MLVSLRWNSAVTVTVVVGALFSVSNIQAFALAHSPADSSSENMTQRPPQLFSTCLEKGTLPGDHDESKALDRLNQCIQNTLDELWPQIGAGIPEIDMAALDPYEFGEFTFQINASEGSEGATLGQRLGFGRSSRLTIEANFTNVVVHNLVNGSSLNVKVNTSRNNSDKNVAHYELLIPNMLIEGNYSLLAEGVPIFRRIEGQGPFWVHIDGLLVKGTTCLDEEEADDYADEKDVTIDGLELELLNLFGGNPVLGAAVNRPLNIHSLALFEEIKPQIMAEIGVMIKRITHFIM